MASFNLILSNLVQILTTYRKWINDKELHEKISKPNLYEDSSGQKCLLVDSKEQKYKIKESMASIFNW